MSNEEKEMLIAHRGDVAGIDPAGGVEKQFLDWRRVRGGTVSGETHHKTLPDGAVAKLGWDELEQTRGSTASWTRCARGRVGSPGHVQKSTWRSQAGRIGHQNGENE